MFYNITKRTIDIICATIGILIFSPIMLLLALWIKIVSPTGPVFADIPDRVGKKDTRFKMLKFRSMVPNGQAWLDAHPEWKQKYIENNYKLDPDPRWLKGAKFYRKTSIDEMPQFFNVLMGDMSIVGPRAYYPFELDEQGARYPHTQEYIDQVKSTKPGITGPWQVGGRSEVGFEQRIKMDADYAKKRSILYDLLIILKTPFAVISQRGSN